MRVEQYIRLAGGTCVTLSLEVESEEQLRQIKPIVAIATEEQYNRWVRSQTDPIFAASFVELSRRWDGVERVRSVAPSNAGSLPPDD